LQRLRLEPRWKPAGAGEGPTRASSRAVRFGCPVAASHMNVEVQFSETHWEITFEPQNWTTRDTSGRKMIKRQREHSDTMAIVAAAGEIAVGKHHSEHQAPDQDEDEDGDELDEDAREPDEWEMEELEQNEELLGHINPQRDGAARRTSVRRWSSSSSFPGCGRDMYSPSTRPNAIPQRSG